MWMEIFLLFQQELIFFFSLNDQQQIHEFIPHSFIASRVHIFIFFMAWHAFMHTRRIMREFLTFHSMRRVENINDDCAWGLFWYTCAIKCASHPFREISQINQKLFLKIQCVEIQQIDRKILKIIKETLSRVLWWWRWWFCTFMRENKKPAFDQLMKNALMPIIFTFPECCFSHFSNFSSRLEIFFIFS